MSGLEIGGIVLGAFPVALIAMDKYQAVLDQVSSWDAKNHRLALETLSLEIRVQEALFRNSYQTLLLSFLDRATVITILSDPHEPTQQQRRDVADKLRRQLGDKWHLYDTMMKKLQKALKGLSEEVKNAAAANVNSPAKVRAFFGRVRFSMTAKMRNGVLDKIKDENRAFEVLTTQMRTLQDLSRPKDEAENSVVAFRECRNSILAFLEAISARLLCSSSRQCEHVLELPCFPVLECKTGFLRWTLGYISLHSRTARLSDMTGVVARPLLSTSDPPGAILTDLCGLDIAPSIIKRRDEILEMTRHRNQMIRHQMETTSKRNEERRYAEEIRHQARATWREHEDKKIREDIRMRLGLSIPGADGMRTPWDRNMPHRDRSPIARLPSWGPGRQDRGAPEREMPPRRIPHGVDTLPSSRSRSVPNREATGYDMRPPWTPNEVDALPARPLRTVRNRGRIEQETQSPFYAPPGADALPLRPINLPARNSQHQAIPERLQLDSVPKVGWATNEAEDSYWLLDDLRLRRPLTTVSLREILESTGRHACFPRYFFEGDRSRLAASLASAVLFYSNRGWLAPDWSASDVLLDAEDEGVKSESLRNPFMLFSLTESAISIRMSASQQDAQSGERFGVRNSWLYTLGTVLLEILLNSPLESYREHREESRAEIAWRIEKLAMQCGGPRWAEIISRCLHCPFPEHPDLSTTAFFDRVYTDVVRPLLAFSKLPSISDYTPSAKLPEHRVGTLDEYRRSGNQRHRS